MASNRNQTADSFKAKVSLLGSKLPFKRRNSPRENQFADNPYSAESNAFNSSSSTSYPDLDPAAFREAIIEGDDGGRLTEYVNSKLIYEAGVDGEGQLMLVFAACNLPDNRTTDYDRLLNLIMFRLDEFVENDYTLVFFAANCEHKPNIKWLFKAYKRLTRKYKKNLKTLYVVHPSGWVRILFTAFGPILSPKFNKKLHWVKTLSGLAKEVPLDQINVPDQVYEYNLRYELEITYPNSIKEKRFFGVPLEILMGENGERGVPPVVLDAVDYLFSFGLHVPDIFRRNAPKPQVRKIISEYETLGRNSVAYAVYGAYAASSVLKTWVNELPTPILPIQLYDLVKSIPASQSDLEAAIYIRDIVLPAMSDPPCIAILLSILVKLFYTVSQNSEQNNMTPAKIASAWAPTWVRSNQPSLDVEMVSVTRFKLTPGSGENDIPSSNSNVVTLIKIMIQFYDLIFTPTLETYKDRMERYYNIKTSKTSDEPPPIPNRSTSTFTATRISATFEEQITDENASYYREFNLLKVSGVRRQGSVFSDESSDFINHISSPDLVSNRRITSEDILERLKMETKTQKEQDSDSETEETSDKK
ncbi:hypothetical protein BB560_005558 [Smittium megazygosporum]|uniref:Rho-GAP domain-containing protein n=1 Tax=Smittium megazygosporum TaxID=133381 RepID=A0A2T9Z3C8_9FUNG|nr:hypothetical protein BB560_005558 [Smittium megazygosporum]